MLYSSLRMTATRSSFVYLIQKVLILGGIIFSGLVMLSFFAPSHWVLELLTHFRLQYSLALLFIVTTLIISKKPRMAFLFGVFLVMNSLLILPFYLPANWRATATNHALDINQQVQYRVFFANINYGNQDIGQLHGRVDVEEPDLLVTVETDQEKFEQLTPQLMQYPHSFHIGRGSRLGTAIWSKQPFISEPQIIWDNSQSYPTVRLQLPASDSLQPLVVYAVHPPPPIIPSAAESRNQIFDLLAKQIEKEVGPILVVGDFNATSWSPNFNQLIQDTKLSDTRVANGLQPSWPTFLPSFLRIPIDHVLVNDAVQVIIRQTLPSIGSDHLPVLVEIGL